LIQILAGRYGRDRGAVTVLVAILLASGVLLGMTALSLDVGTMYGERAQLLNGANAAALAGAEECARPGGSCLGGPIQAMLNNNALDGVSKLDGICGLDRSRSVTQPCPGGQPAGAQCVRAAPTQLSYIEVYAGTQTAGGATVLPPIVSGALVPGHSSDGHMRACARVSWGTPASTTANPYSGFTLSYCMFNQLTGGVDNASGFQTPWPNVPGSTGVEDILPLQGPMGGGACGGLGYVNSGGSCVANASPGGSLTGLVGDNRNRVNGGNCQTVAARKSPPSSTDQYPYLLMPIYMSVTSDAPTGTATFRNIWGIAAFQVTGYKLRNGAGSVDWLLRGQPSTATYCGPDSGSQAQCLRGYFVSVDIVDGSWPSTTPNWPNNLGVNTFKTSG
jgi:hypothetical protein